MQWSKLSGVQRAALLAGTNAKADLRHGRFAVLEKNNANQSRLEAARTLRELDRDADRAKVLANREANAAAIAAFNGVIKKGPAKVARGARVPVKGRALPMQYFRTGGGC